MAIPMRGDLRRQPRSLIRGLVDLHWYNGRGGIERRTGRCIEISPAGLRIELNRPLPVESKVTLQSASLQLSGDARVVHCRKISFHYEIGFEFLGGMEWQPPHATA